MLDLRLLHIVQHQRSLCYYDNSQPKWHDVALDRQKSRIRPREMLELLSISDSREAILICTHYISYIG